MVTIRVRRCDVFTITNLYHLQPADPKRGSTHRPCRFIPGIACHTEQASTRHSLQQRHASASALKRESSVALETVAGSTRNIIV